MSPTPAITLALALLTGCAPMHQPQPPPAEDHAMAPMMSLRRAVRETMEAVAVAREGGSTLRACEVQAHYHIGTVVRVEDGESPTSTLRLGVMPQEHAGGSITLTLLDERCLARNRTPPAR